MMRQRCGCCQPSLPPPTAPHKRSRKALPWPQDTPRPTPTHTHKHCHPRPTPAHPGPPRPTPAHLMNSSSRASMTRLKW
jgi:hypothetical protein